MQDDNILKIKHLFGSLSLQDGIYLVDAECKGNDQQPVIWLYLDTESGGVTLDQCADVSRKMNILIEEDGVFGNNFVLNVSSPGLSRPLIDIRQYKNNIGRTAKVRYKNAEGVVKKGEFSIKDVQGTDITFEENNRKETVTVSLDNIIETKILAVI